MEKSDNGIGNNGVGNNGIGINGVGSNGVGINESENYKFTIGPGLSG